MSNTAVSHIWEIGQKWMRCEASFHIVYDNINQYHKNWHPSIASQTSLESGTAATLIMYPSTHPDAFNAYEYKERRQKIRWRDITVARIWNDIDCKHLEGACIIGILHILLKHIPGLKRFKRNDKATTLGNRQTIRDIIDHQLMIKQEALTGCMIPVSRDQVTISHIRSLKRQTLSGSSAYSSNEYILPLIEEWHKLFAFLKGIVNVHYHSAHKVIRVCDGLPRNLAKSSTQKRLTFIPPRDSWR